MRDIKPIKAAGVWSPPPQQHQQSNRDDTVIVRDGHRVVVVEYDQNGHHNTKVSISPDEDHRVVRDTYDKFSTTAGQAVENAKERIKEASSVLPNLGQGLSQPADVDVDTSSPAGARELICDAYGRCKHKIAGAFGRAKDTVSEKTEDLQEGAKDAVNTVKDKAYDAKDAVGDMVDRTKQGVTQRAQDAKDRAYDAKDTVGDVVEKTKQGVSQGAQYAKDRAYNAREVVSDAAEGVSRRAQDAKRAVGDAAEKARDKVHRTKEEAESVGRTARRDVFSNVTNTFVKAADTVKTGTTKLTDNFSYVMSIVNLLGFATAYGMSVWISFISSNLLARALPRHQFGVVQSKIYPVYFKAMALSIGATLFGHLLGQRKRFSNPADMYQGYNLLASLMMVLTNLYLIEPRATKLMFERMKLQKEEGRGRGCLGGESSREAAKSQTPAITRAVEAQPAVDPAVTSATACSTVPTPFPERAEEDAIRARADGLNSKLKRMNSCSSLLNLLTLMGLTWHLVYLSQHLHNC